MARAFVGGVDKRMAAGPAGARSAAVRGPLALQRLAGNRAVAGLVASRQKAVQRACGCGGTCGPCGGPGERDDADETVVGPVAVQRAAPMAAASARTTSPAVERDDRDRAVNPAAPRRVMVQRVPAFRPNPVWASRGSDQCEDCCQPFGETQARVEWAILSVAFPDEAASRAGCPEIRTVYAQYFDATGSPEQVFDERRRPDSCVVVSLKNDEDHVPHEEPILTAVDAALPALTAGMSPGQSRTKPLSDVVPAPLSPNLVFNNNTRAGGSLFGGIGASGDGDSRIDSRSQDGVIELTTERDGAAMVVRSSVQFTYDLVDGVDFCPGNTGERAPSAILPFVLRRVSKLEAAGMARDVPLSAHYTRRRFNVPKALPIPDPRPLPVPPVRLPSRVLFAFGSAQLLPGADAEIGAAIVGANASSDVQVVGHTDSRGSDELNDRLSSQRAEAVRASILRQRPDLEGRVAASGRGEREPIEPNELDGRDNPAGRAANRRVEISVGTGP